LASYLAAAAIAALAARNSRRVGIESPSGATAASLGREEADERRRADSYECGLDHELQRVDPRRPIKRPAVK
jgi:hypothetical protein